MLMVNVVNIVNVIRALASQTRSPSLVRVVVVTSVRAPRISFQCTREEFHLSNLIRSIVA